MKKYLLLLFVSVFISACSNSKSEEAGVEQGEENFEEKGLFGKLSAIKKMSEGIVEEQKNASEAMEKRLEKGDTIPFHFKQLKAIMPEISGYEKQHDEGSTVHYGMGSYSTATANYKNADGNTIKVTIMDYSGVYSLYTSMLGVAKTGYKMETDDMVSRTIEFDEGYKGMETVHTKEGNKRVELMVGVDYRFVVQINAKGTDDYKLIREAVKSIDFDSLEHTEVEEV